MLRLLLPLLLAPSSVLTRPTLSLASQVVYQLDDTSVTEIAAALAPPPVVQLIYEFSDHTKLENLAARSDGQLLLTAVSDPKVYIIDPTKHNQPPTLLYTFPNATGMTGIAETAPNVFAVVAGNWSTKTFAPTPGSFAVWSIDCNSREPTVKKIASIPDAGGLNEVAIIDKSSNLVLIADSTRGAVWRLDMSTGDYSIAIEDPLFSTCQTKAPLAINGINVFEGMLYFMNSAQRFYGRIAINPDGSAAGEVQVLYRAPTDALAIFDDFALDWAGNAWIATHPNMLTEVTVEGKHRNITADNPYPNMEQPTSTVFGRSSKQQERTLYMTTTGSQTVGGQIFAIDTGLI